MLHSYVYGLLGLFCLSVRLSVCHVAVLYQNGASQDHEVFTMAPPKTLVLLVTKFGAAE